MKKRLEEEMDNINVESYYTEPNINLKDIWDKKMWNEYSH